MNNRKQRYWEWWWQQVLKGLVPETIYRFTRLKDQFLRLKNASKKTT